MITIPRRPGWLCTSQRLLQCVNKPAVRTLSTRTKLFTVAEEVQDALATGRPVVALETTIYTHGYPYPENVALASRLESLVRTNGGVPATIGIVDGKAHVGMDADTLIRLVSTAGRKDTWKLSRRDLGFIGGHGLRGKMLHGGTTIAATMILAHLAGIKIFATGGLGGVHRGGENSMDISADLTELGRTPVAVISSGCKSFLDIPRTIEYLETQGVGVGTFADGRLGEVDFPAFWSRDSGVKSPQTIVSEADAAAIVHAQFSLPLSSGLLLANPVPAQSAVEKDEIDRIIIQAVDEAEQQGITGSANTPFVLKRIRELSNGASVVANQALIESNVIRGTRVAVELAKLESQEHEAVPCLKHAQVAFNTAKMKPQVQNKSLGSPISSEPIDLVVAGSIACDTICNYSPYDKSVAISPIPQTSNPARIRQAAGGVGRNVAVAAHYAGAKVALASVVAHDTAGNSLLSQLQSSGINSSMIRQLPSTADARTAQYVAVNDMKKDLAVAMADMTIFEHSELASIKYWEDILSQPKPQWLVVDGNWSPPVMESILTSAKTKKVAVAFEPVSTAKAARLFDLANKAMNSTAIVPNHIINLATPNVLELNAMHSAAQAAELLASEQWWEAINNLALSSSGSRDKLIDMTNANVVDRGIPQQALQLLPLIPSIITKLGSEGLLLTALLKRGDSRLNDPASSKYVLSRNYSETSTIGGVYLRLFPPAEKVSDHQIVSVNGVGDTLLGVLMAALTKLPPERQRLEDLIPVAQKAAVLTLKSAEAVAPEIVSLKV